jgi:quinolinate synthase
MADMITASQLIIRRKEIPDAAVVCYINSSADVKAASDVCCTSANAVKVVQSLDANEVLFVPDQCLGHYVSTFTDKKISLWPGYCPTHARITPEDISRNQIEHPQAKVMIHPECRPEVVSMADEVLSTAGMLRFARTTTASEIIVGTELGIIHRLRKENPGKLFIPASEQAICPQMKLITLEKILWSLEEMSPEVKVQESIRVRAKRAVDRMLEIGN